MIRWEQSIETEGRIPLQKRKEMMMNGMMDRMMHGGSMMWGMGLLWLVVLAAVVLGVAALAKYLFFNKRR